MPASQTLSFLFTDIESSTRLWELHPDSMNDALKRHDGLLRHAIESANGDVVKTTGDGLMAVFGSPVDAVSACLNAQRALSREPWGPTGAIRVRMALHVGEAAIREGDYYGPTLNRTARIMSVGHGGQVLLSAAAAALVIDHLPDGSSLRDLGEHRLKDLGRAERVFQIVHPDLPVDFPPLSSRIRPSSQLPDEPSSFIGREQELEQIGQILADDATRLLTLLGPGGIGKTRLALKAAVRQIERFEDGAYFIDLSALRESGAVLAAIARELGMGEAGEESLIGGLRDRLRDEQVLLVLDNFEQVAAAASNVAQLVNGCPGLKLLVTSREPLHVSREHLYRVPPLSLPRSGPGHASARDIGQYESVRLFIERARAVRPDFRLTDANAPAIVEICLRLDGLPLAVELAAVRMNFFSPEALLDRLATKLALLRTGARDAPERQQTLRATIDWSYNLLQPGEQRLFELLSVFSSGTLEAIETVASGVPQVAEESANTLEALASLVDKSLVRSIEADGEHRLAMLETIREYASERISDDAQFYAAARLGHAIYYASFAERQSQLVTGQAHDRALKALAAELENMRSSWRYWATLRDLGQLNRLIDSLWLLYDARGSYQATVQVATELLDVLSTAPATPERTMQEVTLRTSLARALMAVHGYTHEVELAYTRAIELLEGQQEMRQLFPVLRGLASFYNYRAEFEKGAQVGREILKLADTQGDRTMRVDGHLVLGSSVALQRDLRAGLEQLEQGIASFESAGRHSQRFRLGNYAAVSCFTTSALILWMLGFPDRALERANRAVALATELEHPSTLAYALFHTGFLHLWRREPQLVLARSVGVLDVGEEHDLQIWRALGTALLGAAKTALGRPEEGLAQVSEGIALYHGLRTPPVFWPLLLYIRAGAYSNAGNPREGLPLIDEAIEIAENGSGLTLLPEFYVLKGELMLILDEPAAADAVQWFSRAFDMAGKLGARMPQLRAAIGLYRSQLQHGEPNHASRLLEAAYARFTEGFEAPDLIAARALLGRSDDAGVR
jgi:predicted ATPase/class 3 adenylate cyclase